MFRLFRLIILGMLVFLGGMLAERSFQQDRCLDLGGRWDETAVCDL